MRPGEIIVDLFAGGGGASLGIELALGTAPAVAINHDPPAVEMHRRNHPQTQHFCRSVFDVNPCEAVAGRPVGLLWASPDCTHFSRAKGGRPVSPRVRDLAWVVVDWIDWLSPRSKPRVICLENVQEFTSWGPVCPEKLQPIKERAGEEFDRFVGELERRGYVVEWRTLCAADYGAPTSRRRLFMVARCDGQPIRWPEATHGQDRPLPYRTAAQCIDWSLPCPSIFARRRPLAEKTLARIARGVVRYVLQTPAPFVVRLGHWGGNGAYSNTAAEPLTTITTKAEHALVAPHLVQVNHGRDPFRASPLDEPAPTVTGSHGTALVAPTLVQTGYGERPGQAPRALDLHAPLGTVVAAGQKHALCAAFLARHYGGPRPVVGQSLDTPTSTVTARDHHGLVAAHLVRHFGASTGSAVDAPAPTVTPGGMGKSGLVAACLTKYHGGPDGEARGQRIEEPLRTLDTSNRFGLVAAFLSKYYTGGATGQPLDAPLDTVVSRDRFALVTVEIEGETYALADIGMRMLEPRELARAQGFPDSYVLTGSKAAQVARLGNSVCPPVACALVQAQFATELQQLVAVGGAA